MPEDRMTFVAEEGVLIFDGQVVESFGFGRGNPPSVRLHTAMLMSVEVQEGGRFTHPSVTIKARDTSYRVFATFTAEEAASPELGALVDAVRAAAPNLEEG